MTGFSGLNWVEREAARAQRAAAAAQAAAINMEKMRREAASVSAEMRRINAENAKMVSVDQLFLADTAEPLAGTHLQDLSQEHLDAGTQRKKNKVAGRSRVTKHRLSGMIA